MIADSDYTDAMMSAHASSGARAERGSDGGGGDDGASSASTSRSASSPAVIAPLPTTNASSAVVPAERRSPAGDDLEPGREQEREASPIGQCSRGRPPAVVDVEKMRQMFGKPQPEAAKALGVSLTTLKQVCRKLGLQRWPYRRPCKTAAKSGGAASATGSGAGVPDMPDATWAGAGSGMRGAGPARPFPAASSSMDGRHSLAGAMAGPYLMHGPVGGHGHSVQGRMVPPEGQRMPAAGASNPAAGQHVHQGFHAGGMLHGAGIPFPIPEPEAHMSHMSHMGWGAGAMPGGYDSRALFDGPGQQSSYMRQQMSIQQQQELHFAAPGEYPIQQQRELHFATPGQYPIPTGMAQWGEQGSRMRPALPSGARAHPFAPAALAQPEGRAGHAFAAAAPPPYVASEAWSASRATPGMLVEGGQLEASCSQPRSPPMPPDISPDVLNGS